MRNVDRLWFVLSILIGVIIGQVTTSYAINPVLLLEQGVVLGANGYYYGCVEAKGHLCLKKAYIYKDVLDKIKLFEPDRK